MKYSRSPLKEIISDNPAGNILEEMQEAELDQISAGAGLAANSGGVVCTLTAECYYGTILKVCCPK